MISNLYDKRDAIITIHVILLLSCVLRGQIGTTIGSIVEIFYQRIIVIAILYSHTILFIIIFLFFLQNETEHVCNITLVFGGIHRVGLRANRCQWVSNSNTNKIRTLNTLYSYITSSNNLIDVSPIKIGGLPLIKVSRAPVVKCW